MVETVYILCALTSLACAILLFRGYMRGRVRLLLWSALCFLGLFANNVLLFADMVVFPNIDLQPARTVAALVALVLLMYGLVWDAE